MGQLAVTNLPFLQTDENLHVGLVRQAHLDMTQSGKVQCLWRKAGDFCVYDVVHDRQNSPLPIHVWPMLA
jgi:hypothetical protein